MLTAALEEVAEDIYAAYKNCGILIVSPILR